jgi:hypothetical protein
MGSFGKAGRTGNAEVKYDLAGILPIAHLGGGALAESAEVAFAAVAADAVNAANAAGLAKSSATALLIHQLISIIIAVGHNIPFRLSLLLYRLRRVTCCNIVEIRNSPKTVPVRASTPLA